MADAEFHHHPLANRSGHGLRLLVQQGQFRARQAVFGLFADGSKQP